MEIKINVFAKSKYYYSNLYVEAYLEKFLESVMNQTFKNIEIIAVNDESRELLS